MASLTVFSNQTHGRMVVRIVTGVTICHTEAESSEHLEGGRLRPLWTLTAGSPLCDLKLCLTNKSFVNLSECLTRLLFHKISLMG